MPLAVRVALIAGFRRALPVFRSMIVVAVAVVMWESPQAFPRGVGRVESRLYGFPCFPYHGISTAFGLATIIDRVLGILTQIGALSVSETTSSFSPQCVSGLNANRPNLDISENAESSPV
jgi:hypothetical protein